MIALAYPLLFGRDATPEDVKAGLAFLEHERKADTPTDAWAHYARALLSSTEFRFVG